MVVILDGILLSSLKDQTLADINLPQGYTGSEKLPKTRQLLKNCFNTGQYILPRPGITSLSTQAGVARGSFVWNEFLYMVFSTSLYKVDAAGATTLIGTIDGTAQIDTDIGFNHAVIIVREATGKGYTLDSVDTLTEIVDAEFVASNSVTHINGRFVYIPFNGDPAFFSDVGNGASIQTTSFFDAEELPDKNKVVFNYKNILLIGGTDSFELFRDTNAPTVVYTRLNARIQFGYIGGITEYSDTFAFIGREKDQDVGIYLIGAGTAPKISNEAIDTILSTYTESELSTAIPARFKWRGYDILTYTLTRHSFGYWGGNWFILDTRIDNENEPWRAGYVTHWMQKYYTCLGSDIGRLDKINTDYGNTFERVIEFGYYSENNNDFTAHAVEVGISQGYTSSGTVGLQLSRDNVLYSDVFFRSTGSVGDYSNKLTWQYPGGLGYYEGFMGFRITSTSDVEFSADKISVLI